MNGVHLEEVQSFHHLDVTKDGSCAVDVRLRITPVTVGMDRLNIIWEQFNFGFKSQSSCPLCCAAARRRPCSRRVIWVQAFEKKGFRKLLGISYREQKTNDTAHNLLICLEGHHEPLLATVKRQRLVWFGHVVRHETLTKTIVNGGLRSRRSISLLKF